MSIGWSTDLRVPMSFEQARTVTFATLRLLLGLDEIGLTIQVNDVDGGWANRVPMSVEKLGSPRGPDREGTATLVLGDPDNWVWLDIDGSPVAQLYVSASKTDLGLVLAAAAIIGCARAFGSDILNAAELRGDVPDFVDPKEGGGQDPDDLLSYLAVPPGRRSLDDAARAVLAKTQF